MRYELVLSTVTKAAFGALEGFDSMKLVSVALEVYRPADRFTSTTLDGTLMKEFLTVVEYFADFLKSVRGWVLLAVVHLTCRC